jgi:predicted MPP superfamily phosphohydrolase
MRWAEYVLPFESLQGVCRELHSRMSASGPPWRGVGEGLERLIYRGGWPARVAARLGYHPRINVAHHRVRLPTTGAGSRSFRIAYASDFHAGPTTSREVLDRACDALAAARPDLLLLGGDFVGTEAAPIRDLAPRLGQIPAPLGRYAVLGNHDWWTDPGLIVCSLEAAGVEMLTNRNVRLPAPYGGLVLCGLDDPWAGMPDARAAFEGAAGLRIVLMHQPSNLLDIGEERFAIALCGHTHGGQIALPGGFPVVVPHGPLSRRYSRGRFELDGGRVLLVSVGVGCSVLPFRLFADPEVLICDVELTEGSAGEESTPQRRG